MEATSADIAAPAYVNKTLEHVSEAFDEIAFNEYFGLLSNETLVIIRPYNGDDDDRVLEEVRPKYVVMYDPDPSFVRRIEVRFSFVVVWDRTDVGVTDFSSSASGIVDEGIFPHVQRFDRRTTLSQFDSKREGCVLEIDSGENRQSLSSL